MVRLPRLGLVAVALCALAIACDPEQWKPHWEPVQWDVHWDWWRVAPTPVPGGSPAWTGSASQPASRADGPRLAPQTRSHSRPTQPARKVSRTLAEWRAWWSQYRESAVVEPVLGVAVDGGERLVAIRLGPGEAARIRTADDYVLHPTDAEEFLARARVYGVNETAGEVYARIVEQAPGRTEVRKGDLAALQAPLR